jgi:hypothetical protein
MGGSHLIPELYHDADADLYFVLRAGEIDEHTEWIRGATHTLRTVNEAELANIRRRFEQDFTVAAYGRNWVSWLKKNTAPKA